MAFQPSLGLMIAASSLSFAPCWQARAEVQSDASAAAGVCSDAPDSTTVASSTEKSPIGTSLPADPAREQQPNNVSSPIPSTPNKWRYWSTVLGEYRFRAVGASASSSDITASGVNEGQTGVSDGSAAQTTLSPDSEQDHDARAYLDANVRGPRDHVGFQTSMGFWKDLNGTPDIKVPTMVASMYDRRQPWLSIFTLQGSYERSSSILKLARAGRQVSAYGPLLTFDGLTLGGGLPSGRLEVFAFGGRSFHFYELDATLTEDWLVSTGAVVRPLSTLTFELDYRYLHEGRRDPDRSGTPATASASTVQASTVQASTVQASTVQASTVQASDSFWHEGPPPYNCSMFTFGRFNGSCSDRRAPSQASTTAPGNTPSADEAAAPHDVTGNSYGIRFSLRQWRWLALRGYARGLDSALSNVGGGAFLDLESIRLGGTFSADAQRVVLGEVNESDNPFYSILAVSRPNIRWVGTIWHDLPTKPVDFRIYGGWIGKRLLEGSPDQFNRNASRVQIALEATDIMAKPLFVNLSFEGHSGGESLENDLHLTLGGAAGYTGARISAEAGSYYQSLKYDYYQQPMVLENVRTVYGWVGATLPAKLRLKVRYDFERMDRDIHTVVATLSRQFH